MSMYVFECLCYSQVGPWRWWSVAALVSLGSGGPCVSVHYALWGLVCWYVGAWDTWLMVGLGACHPRSSSTGTYCCRASMVGLCSDALGAGLGLSAWWPFCLFYPAGVIGCSGYLCMLPGSVWWGYRVPVSQTVTPTGRLTHITHASQTDTHAHQHEQTPYLHLYIHSAYIQYAGLCIYMFACLYTVCVCLL